MQKSIQFRFRTICGKYRTECLKAFTKPEPSRRLCHTVYTTHVSSTNGTSRLVRGPLSCLYSSTPANIRKYDRLSWKSQPFNERKAWFRRVSRRDKTFDAVKLATALKLTVAQYSCLANEVSVHFANYYIFTKLFSIYLRFDSSYFAEPSSTLEVQLMHRLGLYRTRKPCCRKKTARCSVFLPTSNVCLYMWSQSTSVTDGQTDRRLAIATPRTPVNHGSTTILTINRLT